ncbi:MAG: hypothetical protein ACREIC_02205, partial [Limisphaerales bacterium]
AGGHRGSRLVPVEAEDDRIRRPSAASALAPLAPQEEFRRQNPASRFTRASLLPVDGRSLRKDLRKVSESFIQCERVLAAQGVELSPQSRLCLFGESLVKLPSPKVLLSVSSLKSSIYAQKNC